jgi:hypothetical protein
LDDDRFVAHQVEDPEPGQPIAVLRERSVAGLGGWPIRVGTRRSRCVTMPTTRLWSTTGAPETALSSGRRPQQDSGSSPPRRFRAAGQVRLGRHGRVPERHLGGRREPTTRQASSIVCRR